jgi:hypothetical protein
VRWLVRLYPRAWRLRYEEEFLELLQAQAPSLRLWFDVVAGAMDAHLYPQASFQTDTEKKMKSIACGEEKSVSLGRAVAGALSIVGLSLVAVLASVLLTSQGYRDASELTLLLSFPLSTTLTMPLYTAELRWPVALGLSVVVTALIVGGWAVNLG